MVSFLGQIISDLTLRNRHLFQPSTINGTPSSGLLIALLLTGLEQECPICFSQKASFSPTECTFDPDYEKNVRKVLYFSLHLRLNTIKVWNVAVTEKWWEGFFCLFPGKLSPHKEYCFLKSKRNKSINGKRRLVSPRKIRRSIWTSQEHHNKQTRSVVGRAYLTRLFLVSSDHRLVLSL